MVRLSLKHVQKIFKEKGCELLEPEYKNNYTPMKYRCSCGNETIKCLVNFRSCPNCAECLPKQKAHNTLSFKQVQRAFKEGGCELLEIEYKDNQTPMKYRCSCGNISHITYGNFMKPSRCGKCRGGKRITLPVLQDLCKKDGATLITKEWEVIQSKIEFICACGNKDSKNLCSLRNYGVRCKACAHLESRRKKCKRLYTKKEVLAGIENRGFTFIRKITPGPAMTTTLIEYKCVCGEILINAINTALGENPADNTGFCFPCSVKNRSGKNHYRWRHDLTDQDRITSCRGMTRKEIKKHSNWIPKVLAKDNYTCQKCGYTSHTVHLQVHHIEGWASNPKLRFNISNGSTLCRECHYHYHKLFGTINFDEIDYKAFLTFNFPYPGRYLSASRRLSLRRAVVLNSRFQRKPS